MRFPRITSVILAGVASLSVLSATGSSTAEAAQPSSSFVTQGLNQALMMTKADLQTVHYKRAWGANIYSRAYGIVGPKRFYARASGVMYYATKRHRGGHGYPWMRSGYSTVYFNRWGTSENCKYLQAGHIPDPNGGVKVRIYIKNVVTGHNWRSREAFVPCNKSTHGHTTIALGHAPKFYFSQDIPPQVHVSITFVRKHGGDTHRAKDFKARAPKSWLND